MNYATKILNYLANQDGFSQVLLVAGAPPIDKRNSDVHIVINTILTPDDIRDTLGTFASHVRRTGVPDLGRQGVFSFGMPNLGRFRVHYLTQRGSDLVAIQKMPFGVPDLDALLRDPATVPALDALTAQGQAGGIVLLTGPSAAANALLVYSLLKRINDQTNRVIYILEQNLSFLLSHKNSVVIQIEVGTDIPSLEEGIRSGLFLAPDIMHVRDCKTRGETVGVVAAAEAGSLVILSAIALNERFLLEDLRVRLEEEYDHFCRLLRKIVRVTLDPAGKIGLQIINVQIDGTGHVSLHGPDPAPIPLP
jgi:twitching motility protein PilT